MPRYGFFSFSGTPSQSISRLMNSSLSLALCGPPKITAPAWFSSVSAVRIAEARTPHVERKAAAPQPRWPTRPGVECSLMQDDQDRLAHMSGSLMACEKVMRKE